ncbi:MAG: SprT family zinc-dependent metalloprotease [Cyanobacteria bacterium P01_A01_bin.116]
MSQLELFSPSANDSEQPFADPLSQPLNSPPAMPAYEVRESRRAKHVSIKISVEGKVEVVIPPHFERSKLPDILERRREWIVKTRSRLLSAAETTSEDWQVEKPDAIVFRWRSEAVEPPGECDRSNLEIWTVGYQPGPGNKTICTPALGNKLMLKGNTEQPRHCQAVLKKWLAHRAHRDLVPWLRQLGYELDLPCRRISVRGQKTRWASCSSQKDISLNYKLLFLPRPLVHYVLVHELCHTVHMNHSAKFWSLVSTKQPGYDQWKAELKQGWRYVPRWVESG